MSAKKKQESDGVKLADSNMANYGSKDHKAAAKAAALSDTNFEGCGQKPGLEIWRVENRRTASDTPDFGVRRWPIKDYGQFFTGDSYICLNTYQVKDENGKLTDKLAWDAHFWLGAESSQDEIGVAAYKTVELSDILDGGPVHHRECQGFESPQFHSYFKGVMYVPGGIASGFRNVKPENYEPKLFHVKGKKLVRALPVPCKASSLNEGDVFVLDGGLKIWTFVGKKANAFEKMKGGAIAHNICAARDGKAKQINEPDAEFWEKLGGTEKDVGPESPDEKVAEDADVIPSKCVLYKLSDESGSLEFAKVAAGDLKKAMLDTTDVFIVDSNITIFVWIGRGASKQEKSNAMSVADEYLKGHKDRPKTTPICSLHEGQINFVFDMCFKG